MGKKLIAGNWKMNGSLQAAHDLVREILEGLLQEPSLMDGCDFAVFPPFVHIPAVRATINDDESPLQAGAQDCSERDAGAFTGDVAAPMIRDLGCRYVILGHSERRTIHGESSALVAAKAAAAQKAGLVAVVCVGETEGERDSGKAYDVVAEQLAQSLPQGTSATNTVIAYEPVWAIGTGKAATEQDVEAMHAFIRKFLQDNVAAAASARILYGGSVKPDNAASLFKVRDVDGALIGGASLKAQDFLAIARAA